MPALTWLSGWRGGTKTVAASDYHGRVYYLFINIFVPRREKEGSPSRHLNLATWRRL